MRFEVLKECLLNYEGMATLEGDYAASIRDLGLRSETAIMVKDQAHI